MQIFNTLIYRYMKIFKNKVARQPQDAFRLRATLPAPQRTTLPASQRTTTTLPAPLHTTTTLPAPLRAARPFLLLTSLLLLTACSTFTQKHALDYLYEYMPLNDRAEQTREYFEKAVSQAFRTKDLPWAKTVPEDLFKHYVLPPRVNNEYLDNAREVFYRELYPRVKDLSMYNAVLEVNHWCREKVEYRPTDIRTSAPLQTVARGYGRCGEESVVAVSALRSIGIPARQVYAPRWSHTNDNHAWVEVWVDGRWYYLGACEPELELDRGWFTDEASRAMLVHTFVPGDLRDPKTVGMRNPKTVGKQTKSGSESGSEFGSESGSGLHTGWHQTPGEEPQTSRGEEILSFNGLYTELNVLERYAPVKKAVVRVVDRSGRPLEGVQVSFGLYNYAEFYPLAQRLTNGDGLASLTTGLGTLFIEAYFEGVPSPDTATHEPIGTGTEAAGGGSESVSAGSDVVPNGAEAVDGGSEVGGGGQKQFYAAAPFPVPELDTLTLVLEGDHRLVPGLEEYLLTPPAATAFDDSLSVSAKARLDSLCAIDDSLRIARLANQPPGHTNAFLKSIRESEHETVEEEIADQETSERKTAGREAAGREAAASETATRLVSMLNEKDFLEATPETLNDWLTGIQRLQDVADTSSFYWDYVMNPRIANEAPLPYRETLWKLLCEHGMQEPGSNPATLNAIDSIINALEISPELNPRGFPVAPAANALYGIADEASREVLRVALYRTAGIPARIDPVTKRTETAETPERAQMGAQTGAQTGAQGKASSRWRATTPKAETQQSVNQTSEILANKSGAAASRCLRHLRLQSAPGPDGTFPAYDTDFTIQRWENGRYRTLGFGYESGGVTQKQLFNTDLLLPAGLYRIVYGIRADDGSVRVRLERKKLRDSAQETVSEIFNTQ